MAKILYTNDSEVVNYAHSVSKYCDVEIHLHDSCEIFMAVSDNIRYHIEGKAYDLKSGDVVITNEKEIHRPATVDDNIYDRKFIQFRPNIFTPFLSHDYNPLSIFDNRKRGVGNLFSLSKTNDKKIENLFDEIENLSSNYSPKNQLLVKTKMLELFIILEELYHKQYPKENPPKAIDLRITKIIDELDKSYKEPFSLDKLSERHFIDKFYLCRLFKKATGFTLLEYIQSKRIQHAKKLIRQGITITESSRLSGFDDYSNFYKIFKKMVKKSPKKFRDEMN